MYAALTVVLIFALAGCASSGATGGATTTRGAGHATPPGVTSAASSPGWLAYRDPLYGFIIQIPSDAVGVGGSATGATSLAAWSVANPTGGADSANMEVTATTQPSAALCANYTHGTPTPMGGGVTGYAQDNLSQPAATATATSQPQITVILLHARLLTIITLTGQGQPGTFMQRWGAIWSHILTTFQPGQGPASAHPCG